MNNLLKALGIITLIVVALIFVGLLMKETNFGGGDGFTASACNVTHTTALVGHQESRTLLSANSRRAWATIQQPTNATNTVALSFGGTASANVGYILQVQAPTSLASTTEMVSFGLNTDMPFVGAITGRTATASSTVLVTDCIYVR